MTVIVTALYVMTVIVTALYVMNATLGLSVVALVMKREISATIDATTRKMNAMTDATT